MAEESTPNSISTREKVGLACMAVGFTTLVAGIAAAISVAWAAIIGGALLLGAGVVMDRMG